MADGQSNLRVLGEVNMPVKVHDQQFTFDLTVVEMANMDGIWGMDFMCRFQCDLKMSSFTYTFAGQEYPITSSKHDLLPHSVSLLKSVTLQPGDELVLTANVNSPYRNHQQVLFEPSAHFNKRYEILPAKSVSFQVRKRRAVPVQLLNPTESPVVLPKGTLVGYLFPSDEVTEADFSDSLDKTDLTPMAACEQHHRSDTVCSINCFSLTELEEELPKHLEDLYNMSSVNLNLDEKKQLAALLLRYRNTFSASPTDLGKTTLVSHSIDTGDAKPFRVPLRRQGAKKEAIIAEAVEDGLRRGIMEDSSSPWASAPVIVAKKDGTSRFCIDFRLLNKLTRVDSYPLPRFDECVDSLHGSTLFCTLDLQAGYWQVPLNTKEDKEKTAFLTKSGLFQFTVLPFGLCNAPATFERLMETVLRGLQWQKCLIYLDDILIFGRSFSETLTNLRLVLDCFEKAKLKIKPSKCSLLQESIEYLGHHISNKGIKPLANKVQAVQDWPSLLNVPPHKLPTEVKRFLGLVGYYRRFIRNMSQIAAPLYNLTKKNSKLIWTSDCEDSFQRLKAALVSSPILSFPDVKGSNFILDTDASNTGIGGVLSQVQNGQEKVIGYYSTVLSDSERNYCVTKREFLAVVRAIRQFKPYLYGQHFLVRTDNAAVSHLLTLSDSNEQIQRWQLFMSQFKFDLVHRPGHKHVNADSMSRMPCLQCGREEDPPTNPYHGKPRRLMKRDDSDIQPCRHTVDSDNIIDNTVDELMLSCNTVTTRAQHAKQLAHNPQDAETVPKINVAVPHQLLANLGNTQLSDPDIAPIMQLKIQNVDYPTFRSISAESLGAKALRQHWRNLFIKDDILFRKLVVPNKDTRLQVVLPRSMRNDVLQQLHSDPTAGHLGTFKTLERVKQRFYWIGWRRDVLRFVSHCHTCNIVKRPHKKQRVPLTQQLFGEAFERVSIDLIGPLKETPRGYRYAVTMEDNFTKWVEATPLKTMETTEVCNAVIKDLISRFGCMYIMHSDRGPQFVSQLYNSLMKKLGVDRSLTTAYNPKSNGLVENFNKVLKGIMKTYIEDHRQSAGDWDVMLPIFLMAYRSSVHSSTGETPHFMLTAREMKLPIDLLYTGPSTSTTSIPAYVRQLEIRCNKAYALVRDRLKAVQRIQKKQYEVSSPKYRTLQVGQYVWYFNPRKSFKGDRHKPWLGPYLVKQLDDDFTVKVQVDAEGKTLRTHCDKLRHAHGVDLNW
jgi:transposase InsO family protein